MKKITVIVIVLLSIYACKEKIEQNLQPNSKLISEKNIEINQAQKWFEKMHTTTNSKLNGSNEKKPIWENAYNHKFENKTGLVVPIDFQNNYFLNYGKENKKEKSNASIQLEDVNYLLISKDENDNFIEEVVSMVPDEDYLKKTENRINKKVPYEGFLLFKDWNNNLKKGYLFENGKLKGNVVNTKNSKPSLLYCREVYYYDCPANQVGAGGQVLDFQNCVYVGSADICYNFEMTGGGGESYVEPIDNITNFNAHLNSLNLQPCMKAILNSILNNGNGGMGGVIQNFGGNTLGWNWRLVNGDLSNSDVFGSTSPYNKKNQEVVTTFDANKFIDASDLSIARTIIHESAHAYLVSYFALDPVNANKTYPEMVNEWISVRSPDANIIQHNEFVRSFKSDIATSLENYGFQKGYNLPRQFYEDLAWGGLQGTSAYNSLTFSERSRINNVILTELTGKDSNGNWQQKKGNNSGC